MSPSLLAALLVPLYLAGEAALHARRVRRIPIRIHVNGTRGKTSVTRQLTAALRQSGLRTMGKVTGDEPLLLMPDGREVRISRRGPARIQEQLWFIRQACAHRAEAIVVECMALAPALQRVSEERMICSTLGVITNVRPDHFEVMGEDLDAVAAALAGTIPRRGVLVTAEHRYFPKLRAWAEAQGSRAIFAGEADDARPMPPAQEHGAIVRAVLGELGLTSAPRSELSEPNAAWTLDTGAQRVVLVNAFSANDPVSTALLQATVERTVSLPEPRVALLNNRSDRPRRLLAFVEHLRDQGRFAAVALTGDLAAIARRKLSTSKREVWVLDDTRPPALLAELGRRIGGSPFTIVGMGNAKGAGLELARYFQEKGTPCR